MTHELHSEWSIYYHTFTNNDWSIKSYNKLCTIKTIEEYWQFMNNLPSLSNGMFFMMRGNVLPMWEDIHNKNGGAWTLFISNNQLETYLINISAHMVCEKLLVDTNSEINGISITPKHKSFSIKIWNKNAKNKPKLKFNNDVKLYALCYKKHF